ncbi:MAG: hypothetical protein M3Y67_04815 [Pseudomonadota bacterium]|nr:hypothetical protein [Pseudomonadota bacterium]
MITGDQAGTTGGGGAATATNIAKQAGIDESQGNLLPGDKLAAIVTDALGWARRVGSESSALTQLEECQPPHVTSFCSGAPSMDDAAHREADVCLGQGRRIVDAVPGHRRCAVPLLAAPQIL